MKKIPIDLKYHEYDINLGAGLTKQLARSINNHPKNSNVILLIDKKFLSYYKETFLNDLRRNLKVKHIVFPFNAAEKNKTYDSVIKIHSAMQRKIFGRDSLLVAIGGGITGDVGGFAASLYMRGIPYIQVPTTLLAAVDSSVGGKTGINFNGAKNFIGSFYQPDAVFIDTDFFNSLSHDNIICGTGEILKYAYLTDNTFYKYLKRNIQKLISLDKRTVNKVVEESVKFKAGVVIADEKESGLRKTLNLGHTFAHAFESDRRHKIEHGQAVIVGLVAALHLSKSVGLLPDNKFVEFLSLLIPFSEYIRLGKADPINIHKLMLNDKKNRKGIIKFVLLKDIGEIILDFECPKNNIIESIEFTLQYFA